MTNDASPAGPAQHRPGSSSVPASRPHARFEFLLAGAVEEADLHLGRRGGEQGEVDAFAVPGCAAGKRQPLPHDPLVGQIIAPQAVRTCSNG